MEAASAKVNQSLLIVGINHRTAAVEVRERLAFRDDELVPALSRLQAGSAVDFGGRADIHLQPRRDHRGGGKPADGGRASWRDSWPPSAGWTPQLFAGALYRFEGREAIRHLFRVGTSLDSMVIGEPQILGQLKDAYMRAAEAGTVGIVLHRAFHRAFSVAKKVRERTLIGHGAVSVSSAAITLATPDLRLLREENRAADWRGRDGRDHRAPTGPARDRIAAHHQSHFRPRGGAGADPGRHRGSLRQLTSLT